jgi:hypothetical protein
MINPSPRLPGPALPLPAAQPALLLPVRIETRFATEGAQPELWVRVFPDQIAVDSHDPRLTDAEVKAGHRYWRALWHAGTADEDAARGAWQSLAQRFGATRAAFLAHAPTLVPSNLAQRPVAATPAGADPVPPPDFPSLTPDDRRPATPARAARALGLPDRWTVTLLRGGSVVHRATSTPIRSELAVGPDPTTPPTPTPDGLKVDDGVRWMTDFEEALAAGMALRIEITDEDARAGFDRVLVHGLAASDPGGGPAAIRSILDSHRFTDGFALVPQGAPTNNTTDAAAGYTRADPGFAESFALEVGEPPLPGDGQVLADFLGLPAEATERAAHAEGTDQENARQMTVALWPATLGYFLEQMMPEVVGERGREEARAHVLGFVRGRGAVPAIRIGQTPYGIVTSTSLAKYAPQREGRVPRALADLLRRLWPTWQESVPDVPHVQRSGDHDAQLVGVLGMDASSRAYRTRHVLGEELLDHTMAWLNVGGVGEDDFIEKPGKDALARLGYGAWDPRLIHLALSTVEHPVPFPIVVDGPVSETEGLPPMLLADGTLGNYISWLRYASLEDLRDDAKKFPGGPPGALLYQVLRHAVLTEYGRLAWVIAIEHELVEPRFAREAELIGFAKDSGKPTVWEVLEGPMPGLPVEGPGSKTVAGHIADLVELRAPACRRLLELSGALDWLAGLPTAELERLFTETIDTCSHRIDPWAASLALELDHARQGGEPREFHLGAYGWMEDLRPSPQPPRVKGHLAEQVELIDALRRERFPHARPPQQARVPREDNAGFIHAPSLQQAQAGAVLRNGYLTHRETTNGELLAVDVSSERTRIALDLLEGIRQGQPLKALLGYRFERAINAARLQLLLQSFRDAFPLLANKLTEPAGPVEAVAAANVVDGVALHAAWKAGTLWPGAFGATPTQRTKIDGFLSDLDDVLDALGDLSIGESVFQIMRGNPVKAGGMIDAISRGERPPDPEFVRTPRDGIDLTHRVALLFTPGPGRAAGWPGAGHPRALAEPRLDAWVSTLLPNPAQVRCRVGFARPAAPGGELSVTLKDLDLGPLDAVALAAVSGDEPASELEQRVLYCAQGLAPVDATGFEIVFERDPAWGASARTFPEFLVVAQYVDALLAGSRALAPQDLLEPERPAADNGATLDNVELDGRATAAMTAIDAAASGLETATAAPALREALVAGGLFGVPGGVPASAHGADPDTAAALKAQATALAAVLRKRYEDAKGADTAFDRPNATPEKLRDHLLDLLRTVFGEGFALCPRFEPAAASELGAAFAASSSLLDGDGEAPERWLAQLAPVRAGVQRWQAVREGAELLSHRYPPAAAIAQMPRVDPDRWLALPFAPGAEPPSSGRVSILAEVHPAHHPGQPHCGLILDEWPERIPAAEQSTGLAFHFDQPSARAPQALLMAVSPDERQFWDDEALEAVVNETLDMAKARAVDLESIGDLGQLLPALLFPFNADGETVSLQFEDIH